MNVKNCFKCGAEKPLTEFYKHPQMKDGYLNKCKNCNKSDTAKNRKDKADYYLNYDRNRPNASERSKKSAVRNKLKYQTDTIFKDKINTTKLNWVNRNIDKRKAQIAANNALRDGLIERKYNCEHCLGEDLKLQKHHWSYLEEHWLDVIWLCTKCHGLEHKRLNDLGRDPDRGKINETNN